VGAQRILPQPAFPPALAQSFRRSKLISPPVAARIAQGASMANELNDQSVLNHIDSLVKQEESLYAQGELSDDDRARLSKIKVELDQYWDLLRQRRALEEFGENPDEAKIRPAKVVEDYEQ
jgi:Protein of unknown function (DUF2630)